MINLVRRFLICDIKLHTAARACRVCGINFDSSKFQMTYDENSVAKMILLIR